MDVSSAPVSLMAQDRQMRVQVHTYREGFVDETRHPEARYLYLISETTITHVYEAESPSER